MSNKKGRIISARAFLLLFIFFSVTAIVFARGKKDEEIIKTQNDEWILCIVNFDSKAVSEERKAVVDIVLRKLVENINAINYRTRIAREYAFYEESAWRDSRVAAAKAIETKQNERSLLLYKGDYGWMYRDSLKKMDEELKVLYDKLEEIEKNVPLINKEPSFNLTSGNLSSQFPEAPQPGNEYRFSKSQKADALLFGTVSDYHGRFILTLKIYTIFSRSFIWEERIIFSHEDIEIVMEEISRKIIIVLTGNRPSAVAVKAEPEEALILINRSFAGRGETEVLEYPPGLVTITASAPDHESLSFETELVSGELSQISINLYPTKYTELEITGNHKGISGSVYHGAMYVGEAPFTLRLPVNYMEFIELEMDTGHTGRIVYYTPESEDSINSIKIRTRKPQREGSIDRARRMFYWSWAGTWLSGITAWLSYHSYSSTYAAYLSSNGTQKIYDDAYKMNRVYNTSLIALGSFVVLDVLLITRYIYVANRSSTPVRKGS